MVIGESLFNILFDCIEVAFDEVERDMLDIIGDVLDFLN
jgi:hypothetical protein